MLRDFHSLQADDALDRAVEITLAGAQKDFPVLSGPELAGVLRQADLLRALRDHGASCPVRWVMDTAPPSIEAEAGFDAVLERLQSSRQQPAGILAVRRRGDLVGIIDWDNILENALIREALQRNADGPWR
jgi:predicted transcriptional regulator